MDEVALQARLDAIERRQRLILSLIAVAYVLGAAWVLVETVDAVTVWTAGVGLVALALLASAAGMARRRRARQ